MPGTGTAGVVAYEAIHRLATSGLTQLELLEEVARRVRAVVPYDSGAWMTVDPATLLHTGVFVEGAHRDSGAVHLRYADNEYLAPDFLKLVDVARLRTPVLTLREATGGDQALSRRHRTIHADLGVGEELRAVFRSGATVLGAVCLCRDAEQPEYSKRERDFVASIAGAVGEGLRLALLLGADGNVAGRHVPGVIVLRADDSVESVTAEAEHWLAQIPRDLGATLELSSAVLAAARRARSLTRGGAERPARSRIRLPSGQWLLVHAAPLLGRDPDDERVVVILEPARAAELAPLVVDLYELTSREREVTELLTRGLGIDEIAARLWISRHTVRDHTKAIFAKVGVGSRAELTAKLFHEHYLGEIEVHAGAQAEARRPG